MQLTPSRAAFTLKHGAGSLKRGESSLSEGVADLVLVRSMNAIRLFLALVAISASAADIRDTVMAPAADAAATDRIVPDVAIYGMPYGCSEDAFIAKFGRPTGYIRITETQSAMLYGKSHAFFFTNGGLSGVRITQDVLDWRIANAMSKSTTFDVRSWQLDNGIRDGMNLVEVKRILGER